MLHPNKVGVSFYEAETTGIKIYHAYPQRFPCTVACFCYDMGPEQIQQCQGFVKRHILLSLQLKVQLLLC